MADPNTQDRSRQRDLEQSERETFGAAPLRGPDGLPMERGSGSRYAAMSPAARAHFHAVASVASVEEVMSLCKQLTDACGRLAREHKTTIDSALAAKNVQPVPADAGTEPAKPSAAVVDPDAKRPTSTNQAAGPRAGDPADETQRRQTASDRA